jgi:hypothetical protein
VSCNWRWKFSSAFNQPLSVPGCELQGISFPCYESRRLLDFIQREDGRLVIALGDVSGKGTAAALLMSSLHAAINAQTGSHDTLVKTISAVNRYLADNIPSNRFVTLFYAELDPESGAVSFLNAGHNPPLIVHAAGTVEQLASGGLPLGIKADADYREGRASANGRRAGHLFRWCDRRLVRAARSLAQPDSTKWFHAMWTLQRPGFAIASNQR